MSRSGTAGRLDNAVAAAEPAAHLTGVRAAAAGQTLAAGFAMPHRQSRPGGPHRQGIFALGLAGRDVPCRSRFAAARIHAEQPLTEQGQVE